MTLYIRIIIVSMVGIFSMKAQEYIDSGYNRHSRWCFKFSAGMQYNFQSDLGAPIRRKGQDIYPRILPDSSGLIFDQKNPVGTTLTYELSYQLNLRFTVGIGFTHTSNWGKYYISVINGNMITVLDHVRLRNVNRFYYLYIQMKTRKPNRWKPNWEGGVYLLDPHYAELILKQDYFESRIRSGFNEYHLATWGIWLGTHFRFLFSSKFSLGLQSRIFWTVPHSRMENWTISPYLLFNF